jgi:hypothetical protein
MKILESVETEVASKSTKLRVSYLGKVSKQVQEIQTALNLSLMPARQAGVLCGN